MDQNSAETALEATRAALDSENYILAFETLRPVLEYDAGRLSAWFMVGELCVNARELSAAERAFSLALALEPDDVASRRLRAYTRYWSENYDAALDDLNYLVSGRLLPADSETILRLRSDCYYGMGRFSWALDDISEAVIRFPHEESGRKWRDEMMRRLLRASEDADAIETHLEARAARHSALENNQSTDDFPPLDPKMASWNEADLRCLWLRSLENAGREDDARAVLRLVTDHHGDNSYCCQVVGEIYWRHRDIVRARYWNERAIALAPGNAAALWQMGILELEIARREAKVQRVESALRFQLQAARGEDESALNWIQAEWKRDFAFLGEVDFLAILQKDAAPETQDSFIDPRPSAQTTDWDQILENPEDEN